MGKAVELECGDISASQEDLLARAPFLADGGREEPEAFGAPASVPDPASASERLSRLLKAVELECGGDISASQEGLLARAPFLGGGVEEPEVFSTPPLTHPQEEDVVTMCSVPFTQPSPSPAPSSPDSEELRPSKPRKPRVCTRKVRGARIRTPTPSPEPPRPSSGGGAVDPLYKALLMIPAAPPAAVNEDILVLARKRGIF